MSGRSPYYATETQACEALDTVLAHCDLWRVYREVSGTLIQPMPCQLRNNGYTMRIDRVLIAGPKLCNAGWSQGIVGIEVKNSENAEKGKVISQALDYRRSVWTLPVAGSPRVHLDWVFVFPLAKEHGPLASIMAQNRLGTAVITPWSALRLCAGEAVIFELDADGRDFSISSVVTRIGTRVGSR